MEIEHTFKREEQPQVQTLMWMAERAEREAYNLAQFIDMMVARYHGRIATVRDERLTRHIGYLTDLSHDLRSILLDEVERDRVREIERSG